MFNYNKYALLILIIFLLPIVSAELQPAFLDQNTHFLGEEINFGLVGIIPEDFNYAQFEIIMPNGYSYREATLDLENLGDYYIIFPFDFIHPQVKVKYIYYNSNNTETLNQEYTLQFTKLPIMENIKYCINTECDKTTFETLDTNEIILNTQTEIIDDNISFDILVAQEGYVIENALNQRMPYNIDTTPGEYELEITPKYNNKKFETVSLSLTAKKTEEKSQSLGEYMAEIKEQNEENEIMITSETTEISFDDSTSENNKSKNTLLYIGIGILGVIIIAVILFNKKPKTKDKENRRQTRNQRGFLLFVVFLLCLSSIHAASLEEKTREYQNLEITFDKFQELYPKPVIFPIYISNTQPKNTVYYPLSATGLGDFENITPVLENKTKNMTVSLETVYLAGNLEKMVENAKAKGAALELETGCEQVMDWFYQNVITEDPNSVVKRTKTNLLKDIIITDKKNGYTDIDKTHIKNKIAELKKKSQYKKSTNPMVDYCVSEVLTKKKSILEEPYLIEKKMLLKIEYEEKNQEAITSDETTITDNIIFLNNQKTDVSDGTFMGSDLSHIVIYVDYTNDILKEQNIVFEGIEKEQLLTENQIIDDEKITIYKVPNLKDGQELTIKYTAQLLNIEIADSEYGYYYRFQNNSDMGTEPSPEKKGYEFLILDKELSKLRNKFLSNVELTTKIKLNNGKYEFLWDTKTKNLLAEVNFDPTKYILLDKKILIQVGDETNGVNLGIDKDYGIIGTDAEDITILLEEDKTMYSSQNPNNLHLETLKKIFLKTSTHKNIELIRLQLPLLFIFNFKKNAQTITNEDELYLKTYDDLANLINETKLTKIEKNIIFNNLISLTEDFSFQKPGGELYKFRFKTRLVLNYGLVKYIDNPKTIDSLVPEKINAAIPYLYDNDYLERKGFVDKSLTELLVLGYLGENYSSKNSKRQIDPAFDNLAAYEYDLKSQIQQMFVVLKADYQNWGYYKQLLSYPFYRSGFEQKICSYDKDNFPKVSVKDYCYVAYNLNPSTDNWGILYDSDNLNTGFLMQEGGFQNNYVSAYRTILLFEDIDSFKNNKLTFNQNQLKTYNKLNVFFNLIELEATRNRGAYGTKNYGTAIILSYKLKDIWNSNTNELKQYDVENNIGKQIDNIINVLTYQATVKLRSTIASDRILRLDAYKNTYETDAHRYEESINPSGGFFDLSDSARFLITGGWFQTLIFKGKENEIKKIESIDREKYNKLLNGACCISQRLGELENTSTYKNWTVAEIKGTYSPYSKSNLTRKDQIGWATEGAGCIGLTGTSSTECSRDIQSLYNSKEYGKDVSIILNDTKEKKSISSYLTPHYNIKLQYNLDLDQSIQLNSTERELKEKVAELKPGTIGSILRFIDAGINPAAIVITVATVGIGHGLATGTGGFFTRIASGFSAKLGASTAGSMASTVSARVLYELGENVVIDGAYGALAFTHPEIAGKHPFMTCIVLGIIVGNFNRPLSNIDNVARGMTTDIITNAGLKNADNLKVQNAIKNALNLDYQDTTHQLLNLRNGGSATDAFFRKIPKIVDGAVDDDLVKSIQKNLLAQKISVSEDVIRKSLGNNNLYLTTRATAVTKFLKSKKEIQLKSIATANADATSNKFVKLVTDRTNPERYGIKFTSIVDEFEDLKRFNEIDPEHFVKPTKIIYDDYGNPLGYEMERVSGVTLADYIDGGGVLDDSFYKRIEDSVDKLHKQGFAHGDINPNNIILRETYDGLDFTIVDPVGFRKIADSVNLKGVATSEIYNADILTIRNLKNYTTSDKLLFNTNFGLSTARLNNYWKNNELIPIQRSDGTITLATITSISEDGTKIEARFFENGNWMTRPCDVATEVYTPINKNDLIFVDFATGPGKVTNIESNGRITYKLPNGDIRYTDAGTVINSRKLNSNLENLDTRKITKDSVESFVSSTEKLPSEVLFISTTGWADREIIYVNKINDPVLSNYLENAKEIGKNLNPNEKILAAYKLVNETFITSRTIGTEFYDNAHVILDGLNADGQVVPLGYFIKNKLGVCRHHALLLKLTLDEMGLDSKLVRGNFFDTVEQAKLGFRGDPTRHVWVEVSNIPKEFSNGHNLIVDTAMKSKDWVGTVNASRYVPDSSVPLYKPKNSTLPKSNFESSFNYNNRTAPIQNVITDTFRKSGYGEFISEFLTKKYRFNTSDIEELMKLQNNKIKQIYQNDGLLLTINSRLTLANTPTNIYDDIIPELSKRNITIKVVDDFAVQRGHGSGNYATLNLDSPDMPVIEIERSVYNDPNHFLREIRHEYGAYVLTTHYGGKSNIPAYIIPNRNSYEPVWATHYLDHYIDKGYNKLFAN